MSWLLGSVVSSKPLVFTDDSSKLVCIFWIIFAYYIGFVSLKLFVEIMELLRLLFEIWQYLHHDFSYYRFWVSPEKSNPPTALSMCEPDYLNFLFQANFEVSALLGRSLKNDVLDPQQFFTSFFTKMDPTDTTLRALYWDGMGQKWAPSVVSTGKPNSIQSPYPQPKFEYQLPLDSNGTLFQHIHNKAGGKSSSSLSWKSRLRIATESAGALAYLHSSASIPIIHRDIKSVNILLDENFTAKVSDFGASRLNTVGEAQIDTLVQGTLGYLDPEYFLTSQLIDKSDVYSFGVVLVELLTGEKPLSFDRPQEQRSLVSFFLEAIEKNDVFKLIEPQIVCEATREHFIAVVELASKCLSTEGEHRPTMKQVAAELESLCKLETSPSGVHNQQTLERKPNKFIDDTRDLYSVSSAYTSGDSGQYSSMENDMMSPMNRPR
ncbi:wall-associated receptor kinase 5-like [Papaver somniferum]|uniref:wall-associated receptor kinase 5-like n=1 Tax=Papaver somniferum TaxID=3469 RepID=UPI000E6F9311|nr:wall-associated receptor kinase 5-like [Papaver somniferum]